MLGVIERATSEARTYAAKESDVEQRGVRVDELERKELDNEHIVVLRLSSMILCKFTATQSLLLHFIRYYTIDDLHWKTDRQAASFI